MYVRQLHRDPACECHCLESQQASHWLIGLEATNCRAGQIAFFFLWLLPRVWGGGDKSRRWKNLRISTRDNAEDEEKRKKSPTNHNEGHSSPINKIHECPSPKSRDDSLFSGITTPPPTSSSPLPILFSQTDFPQVSSLSFFLSLRAPFGCAFTGQSSSYRRNAFSYCCNLICFSVDLAKEKH